MYIFEIIKPGTWIESNGCDWAREVETILSNLESVFYEANLSLNMFHHARQRDANESTVKNWRKDADRRAEIAQKIREEYEDPYEHSIYDEINLKTEILFKREQWQAGCVPRLFEHNQPFIFARAFLYALDSFEKFVGVLTKVEGIPKEVFKLHDEIKTAFPDLRGVRNSAQHMEDRSRGLGAGQQAKQMDLKAIDNDLVKSESGALVLNCLNGTKYGNTMSDGCYGEVDVSPNSMEVLTEIFQKLLNLFIWEGPKHHLPN